MDYFVVYFLVVCIESELMFGMCDGTLRSGHHPMHHAQATLIFRYLIMMMSQCVSI